MLFAGTMDHDLVSERNYCQQSDNITECHCGSRNISSAGCNDESLLQKTLAYKGMLITSGYVIAGRPENGHLLLGWW